MIPRGRSPRLTLDDALVIWRAREVHRVQCFFYGLGFLLLLMDWVVVTHALGGFWGTLLVAFHVVVFWTLWRVLCWVVGWLLRRASSMYRWLLVGIIALCVAGCTDIVQKVATTMGCPGYYSLDHNCQSPERKP